MNTACFVTAMLSLALLSFSPQNNNTGPSLSELEWMAGGWAGTDDAVEMEELWQSPKGNTMLGVHRDVVKGRTVSFEFLRIEATPDGITYWGSPEGKTPTPFRLKELKNKRAVFENPEHDFPQRIIYWLGDDGALHAKIEGSENGKNSSMEWAWKRVAK
ncbi:MAG TPA: DUF6265 family protein [Pyrinomonadaceae bacterium]|nr:DUF6265 family protein [Pyrinomonadaceae bacterium]